MPIDASIYGNIQKPENPLDAYGKALNLKALMGQSRLQELQTTKAERDLSEEQALHDVFAKAPQGATLESLVPDALRASPRGGIDLQGKVLKQKELQGNIDKTQLELTAKSAELHREQLANVNDPQSAAQWVQAGYADPHIAPILSRAGTVEQAISRIPQDPAQFQEWKAKNGMGIQKFLEMQNTNREHAANRDVTREGHAITERGQNMTDQRQRELNGILDGQGTADITPTATAIANHDIPLPNPPSGSRNPMAMVRYNDLVKKVKEINPNYNAADYPVSVAALKAFGTGKQGQEAQAANTGVNHLATLEQLALAQKNGQMQLFNKIANEYAAQTGGTAPTTFRAALTMVAPEITKAVVGAGGGVEDRAKSAAALNPNYSPEQFLTAAGGMKELFAGRLSEAERTYARTTLRKDFREKLLSPAAKEILDKRTNAVAGGATEPSQAKPGALVPVKGAVQDGYRFKGGNPADQANWEKM